MYSKTTGETVPGVTTLDSSDVVSLTNGRK
jgi:hypothetical protein